MKKFLSILAGLVIVFSFSACSQSENSPISSEERNVVAVEVKEEEPKQQTSQSIEHIDEDEQVGQSIIAQTTEQGEKQTAFTQNKTEGGSQQSASGQEKTEGSSQQSTSGQGKTEGSSQQSTSGQGKLEESTQQSISAQGKTEVTSDEESKQATDKTGSASQAALYIGEYKDEEVNEPNLQIQQNRDGTFLIQIGIHRIASMYDGKGILTEKGMEFTITAPDDEKLTGIITLKKDVATVTFTNEVWAEYSTARDSFNYYKTSDIPNIYLPDYMDLGIETDPFVGEYNDYDVEEPNLEIQKNEDGTYLIQIGIFRLTTLDDCIGTAKDGKIEFSAKLEGEAGEKASVIKGTITLDGDVATVTFDKSFWFAEQNVYKYHKTSDIPHIYEP